MNVVFYVEDRRKKGESENVTNVFVGVDRWADK